MSLDLNIKKDFGGFLLDVELHAENEVLALLGASGCGKSMTLKCIAGIVRPDEGFIIVNGKTLFDSEKGINISPQERGVGLLFQNYALFPNMSVEQNIMTGMNRFSVSRAEKRAVCRETMKKFYLDGLEKHKPSQLSGGQQQRAALARIMVSKPDILMLDEPFSALDSFLRWELEQELMRVLEDFEGTSIIVSHNRDEVYRISDHIAVIADGKVDCYDEKERMFTEPKTYQSALLTGCHNFSRVEHLGKNRVRLIDWNTELVCEGCDDAKYIALRPGIVKLEKKASGASAGFRVDKVIDNFNEIILLLSADSVVSEYSNLNVRVTKEEWQPFAGSRSINLSLSREGILILNR